MEPRLLGNAPIKEAVIDIRVRRVLDSVSKIQAIHDKLKSLYPEIKTINQGQIVFEMKRGGANLKTSQGPAKIGARFMSADRKNVVQMRTDGMTFSRLRPYENWEVMREEAKRLWNIYCDAVSPKAVLRLAVRFINIVDVPREGYSAGKYLTYPPSYPCGEDFSEDGFLTRAILANEGMGARVSIAQARENGRSADSIGLLLDIDVSTGTQMAVDDPVLWKTLEKFRHLKNKVFFNSITSATEELVK